MSRISELPEATALTGAEMVPVVQDGQTRRTMAEGLTPRPAGYVVASAFSAPRDGTTDARAALQAGADLAASLGLVFLIDLPGDYLVSDTLLCDRMEMRPGARLKAGPDFHTTATPIETHMQGDDGEYFAVVAPTSAENDRSGARVSGLYWRGVRVTGNSAAQDAHNYAGILCIRVDGGEIHDPHSDDALLGVGSYGGSGPRAFAICYSEAKDVQTFAGLAAEGGYESLAIRQWCRNLRFFGTVARDGGTHSCQIVGTSEVPRPEGNPFPRPDDPDFAGGTVEIYMDGCAFERTKAAAALNVLTLHTGRRITLTAPVFKNGRMVTLDFIQDVTVRGARTVLVDDFGGAPNFALLMSDSGEPIVENFAIDGWDIWALTGENLSTAVDIGGLTIDRLYARGIRFRRDNLDDDGGPRTDEPVARLLQLRDDTTIRYAEFAEFRGHTIQFRGARVERMVFKDGELAEAPSGSGPGLAFAESGFDADYLEFANVIFGPYNRAMNLQMGSEGRIGHLVLRDNEIQTTSTTLRLQSGTIERVTHQNNEHAAAGFGFNAGGAVGVVSGNVMPPGASPASSIGNSENLYIRDNANFVTQNQGVAEIGPAETSVVVTHGIDRPGLTAADVVVTPAGDMGSAARFWVSDVGGSTFQINVDATPGAAVEFAWRVDASQPRPE